MSIPHPSIISFLTSSRHQLTFQLSPSLDSFIPTHRPRAVEPSVSRTLSPVPQRYQSSPSVRQSGGRIKPPIPHSRTCKKCRPCFATLTSTVLSPFSPHPLFVSREPARMCFLAPLHCLVRHVPPRIHVGTCDVRGLSIGGHEGEKRGYIGSLTRHGGGRSFIELRSFAIL